MSLFRFKRKPKQTTWAYCPICKHDLCTSEGTTVVDNEFVLYDCGVCHAKSKWDFDTPAPILLAWTHLAAALGGKEQEKPSASPKKD